MSSVKHLREFISQRLTAAAEEIFSEFEITSSSTRTRSIVSADCWNEAGPNRNHLVSQNSPEAERPGPEEDYGSTTNKKLRPKLRPLSNSASERQCGTNQRKSPSNVMFVEKPLSFSPKLGLTTGCTQ
ncbi:unnamed protein product, partial [Menidia menidia]